MTFVNANVLSDGQLLLEVRRLTASERQATARLIAALGELDARRLYLAEGCASLFTYCTEVLHLSEHAAYLRIETARAARRWPSIVELIADGTLHLTAVSLLAPHLTEANHAEVLAAARHKSRRAVEELVARIRPMPAVPPSIRKLPVRVSEVTRSVAGDRPGSPSPLPSVRAGAEPVADATPAVAPRPQAVKPLAPEVYKVQFTISRETHDRLREAQDLLRHCIPNGDLAAVFDRALLLLLNDLRRARHASTDRPHKRRSSGARGRHVPAAVKRQVWARDAGQCAFIGTQGRCTERGFLEYHHVVPFADGGETTVDNLELRCRAHNAYEAQRWDGDCGGDLVREPGALYHAGRFAWHRAGSSKSMQMPNGRSLTSPAARVSEVRAEVPCQPHGNGDDQPESPPSVPHCGLLPLPWTRTSAESSLRTLRHQILVLIRCDEIDAVLLDEPRAIPRPPALRLVRQPPKSTVREAQGDRSTIDR